MAAKEYDTEPYLESIRVYRDALAAALAIASDPFKAPEITVSTGSSVQAAAFNMQVQYHAMTNYRGNVRDTTKEEKT